MAAKPPPGLSMMEELKWKQQNKTSGGGAAGGDKKPGDKPAAPGTANTGKPLPPPGRKTQAPTSPSKPGDSKSASAAPGGGDGKSPPTKVANSLASRQAMLANIMGSGGGGGPPKKDAPQPKKDGPPAAKKWGKVDTDGGGGGGGEAKLGAGAVKLEKPTDISKYEKMAKMLPQGAVENAMVRDGFDPGYLFENCVTMKSDKKPIKAGGGDVAAAPAAVSAPTAPAAPTAPVPAAAPLAAGQPQYAAAGSYPQQPAPVYGQPQGYDMNYQQNSGWVQTWSPQHNCYYYSNAFTGQTSWEPPVGFQMVASAAMPQPPGLQAPIVAPGVMAQGQVLRMVYSFNPTGANSMEIPVLAQDQVEVYHIGADGWLQVRCLRTGQIGLVPQSTPSVSNIGFMKAGTN